MSAWCRCLAIIQFVLLVTCLISIVCGDGAGSRVCTGGRGLGRDDRVVFSQRRISQHPLYHACRRMLGVWVSTSPELSAYEFCGYGANLNESYLGSVISMIRWDQWDNRRLMELGLPVVCLDAARCWTEASLYRLRNNCNGKANLYL